jgi:hypothetical protein
MLDNYKQILIKNYHNNYDSLLSFYYKEHTFTVINWV